MCVCVCVRAWFGSWLRCDSLPCSIYACCCVWCFDACVLRVVVFAPVVREVAVLFVSSA